MAPAGIGHSVEGFHAVAAALGAGRVRKLTIERGRVGGLEQIVAGAEATGVSIEYVDDVRRIAATDAPQGVVAECAPIVLRELGDAIAADDPASILVLDHLEDPRNVGAIARSAVAAGVSSLVVSNRRAAPLEATAFKAAAGALEHLVVCEVSSIASAIEDLRRAGVWSVGLDAGGDRSLFGLDLLAEPCAIVLGAEGAGMSRLVSERVDVAVSIPLHGKIESLNASVAAALACYEMSRIRNPAGS